MNLNELQIKAELRGKWQALDLGIALAKRWYLSLFLVWIIPAALVLVVATTVFHDSSFLAWLTFWWFKPLYDRAPLYYLSRYLFNEQPERVGIRKLLSLYKTDLIPSITWRRLDPNRSFNLAVTVLEQLKGSARSNRISVLQRNCGNAAFWLTLTMVHLESFFAFGLISLAAVFVNPEINQSTLEMLVDNSFYIEHGMNYLYLLSASVIAPFYVACGFSLYINRRIELEAWDIEIIFRQSAEEFHNKSSSVINNGFSKKLQNGLKTLLAPLLFCGLLLPYDDVKASETDTQKIKQEVITILQSPPFVIEETVTEWRWLEDQAEAKNEKIPDWLISFLRAIENITGLQNLVRDAALFLEIAIWIGIGIIIILLISRYRQIIKLFKVSERTNLEKTYQQPDVIMGLKVTAESLPDDIPTAVEQAVNKGDLRLALSLLYRSALHHFIKQYSIELESWHTESECNQLVCKQVSTTLSRYFSQLTTTWQQLAYAHKEPQAEEILAFAKQWQQELAHES